MTKPPTFAAGTSVSAEQTRIEIERLVNVHGADAFGFGLDGGRAQIRFRMVDRLLRFDLVVPQPGDEVFRTVRRGGAGVQKRTPAQAQAACDRAVREKWRALLLTIKAKFTAVEAGIVTFEEEFLAHVVMSDGRTVGEIATRQLAVAHEGGAPPPMLEHYTGGRR